MVAEPVGYGGCRHRIAEDVGPHAYPHVRRHDRRPPLVPPGDELEDEVGPPLVDLQVAQLVQYQQRQVRVEAHPALQLALVGRALEVLDEMLAADEVRQPAVPHGLHAERDREMGLPVMQSFT